MTGIQFLTDEKGRKAAAVIDLRKQKALWQEHRGCADFTVAAAREANSAR